MRARGGPGAAAAAAIAAAPVVAIAGAALLTCAGAASGARTTDRLGDAAVPASQDVVLELDPARTDYTGSTVIALEIRRAVDRVRLHAEAMDVARAELVAADGERREAVVSRVADDLIEVSSPSALAPGTWDLELDFAASFATKSAGLYRVEEEGRAYLFTQFESDDARDAFPCFDEPAFKIPFRLTLVTPEDMVAVSNTAPETERTEAGRRTTVFARTPPMPTYLVAIAVGPFDTVEIPGLSVPGRIVTAAGKAHLAGAAVEVTPPLLAAAERWFGSRIPYDKLDLIAVPRFWPGAMENAGAITFREDILLVDPAEDTPSHRRRLASVTAHELAHQWFGNLVTMEWWDDLWLNESFADWMGNKLTDEVYPELRQGLTELQGAQRNLEQDARPSTKPVRRRVQPGEPLMEGVGLAYAKGRTVLGMLEGWMGAETVRRGVLAYLRRHEWGNAEAADLWAALDEASGRNVSEAIAGFLEQPGFPLIRVEPLDGGRVRVSQGRFRNAGVDVEELRWIVPIVLRWREGDEVRTRSVLLDAESREIDLEARAPVAWVYPNGGGSGYYRWWTPAEPLAALAADAAERLEPGERVELVGNLESLLQAGAIDGATYLRTLTGMQADQDPAILGALAAAVGSVRSGLVTPGLEDAFADWVRATLRPGLERIGREPRAGEPEAAGLVRPQLLATLADEGADRDVRAWAHGRTEDYLEDPRSVDPGIAAAALRIAALDGDAALLGRFRERCLAPESPGERQAMIRAMASFRHPELRRSFLEWALHALRPEDFSGIGRALNDTEDGREAWFRFVVRNFDEIATLIPAEFVAFLPSSGGGCSTERVQEAREFFGDPSRAVTGTESALRRTEDSVRDCVRLREREGESVAAFLRGRARAD
jgi:alanyl aminopeptidase